MRSAVRQALDEKRAQRKPRRKYERTAITEAEADELLAKHAPDWLEHLYWDDEVLNRVLTNIARAANGKRQTAQH